MATSDPRTPARYYLRLADLLQQRGINLQTLLNASGLDAQALLEPDASLSVSEVERLVAATLASTSDSDLAFELARSLKLSSHDMLGYGLLSSPNLGYALRLLVRYFPIILPTFQLRIKPNGQWTELDVRPSHPLSPNCLNFHLEAVAVAIHLEARELLNTQLPRYDLYLSIPPPKHIAHYQQLHEARCHFNWRPNNGHISSGCWLRFPNSIMERPLTLADASALRLAEQRCADLVQRTRTEKGIGNWVKLVLTEAHDEMPTQQELAKLLNMSTRTLERSLKAEGLNYRALAKQIRFERACALLLNHNKTVLDISLELGFKDSANFTRAFRQMAGCAPSQWRQQHALKQ